MPLGEGGGGVPDLGRESRPPGLVLPPFSKLSLEDQEIGRGEVRERRHRQSACARCRQLVPHAYRRDTRELETGPIHRPGSKFSQEKQGVPSVSVRYALAG